MASWGETELRKAIERDQFIFHFQPQLDLRTERVVGFEALARWHHQDLGLIAPQGFIGLVEQPGLSDRFTANMLHKAFAAWREFMPDFLFLSVNIFPAQIMSGALPSVISRIAQAEGFALDRLAIEITESSLLEDLDAASTCAASLKKLGVRLALDDFGIGYSSLRHLQALPFDEIKIDKSFIRSMMHQRESRKIVAAIAGLGHSLGLTTTAEGVEEHAEGAMLLRMGCDRGQGWLYGKPMLANEIPEFLSSWVPQKSPCPGGQESIDGWANMEAQPCQRLAQLQAIYDGAPVGLCFVNAELRFVSLNDRLAKINRRSIGEHLGRTVAEIIPEVFPQIEPHLNRALQGEAIQDLVVCFAPRSPEDVGQELLANYQPVWDEAREVVGVVVAITEMTNRAKSRQASDTDRCLAI